VILSDKLSLTELQLIIKDSLYMALPDMYWVTAEVSEIKENYAGHCYLELIEKQSDEKNVSARVRAIIWNNRYRFLKSLFENITGESFRAGMKVLVRVKVEYHELYGLSLIISDIDPSFTIGEMAVKRQMIIRKLEEEGVFSMNKELELPFVPRRIAVISSGSAAGFLDFMKHLRENSYGYVFYTALFETIMQGTETEKSVISALDRIAVHSEVFDVVAILRGGGSQSDLSWFDNYNIAYHVTQFPLPVITGIGHEKDLSVTDMVAFRSLKTPTAVADYLINCIAETEDLLNEKSSDIAENTRLIIEKYRDLNESYKVKLIPLARLMISDQKEKLSNSIIEMINFGKDYIARAGLYPANHRSRLVSATGSFILSEKTAVDRKWMDLKNAAVNSLTNQSVRTAGLENSLTILNPENVLKRGYTITIKDGRIIKSAGQVAVDDIIDTRFSDGKIKSKVFNNKPDKFSTFKDDTN
jgi:exodeoxyribonuclease VII large subunit